MDETGPIIKMMMKRTIRVQILGMAILAVTLFPSKAKSQSAPGSTKTMSAEVRAKSDSDLEKKASEWIAGLNLNDAAKEARLKTAVATHLKTIRDWHNDHPFTTVPAGINPATGNKLSDLDRQVIANSAMPAAVHENLMSSLRKDLTEPQVEAVKDRYTVGKVAFTIAGYKAIVPNLTAAEEATILTFLKQAREQALDYKNMNQISAIFEIYKTKAEQYLNSNGRSWKQMYKDYTNMIKAKKAEDAKKSNK